MVEVGEQVGPTKMRRRQSSVAVDIAKERNRNFYSQYKSGDQMVKMRAEQVKQAREKVGTYTSRDGKSQKVDVSHIQSTNRRLKQQQIDMQEKARKEKEETTQKERLRKAELQMYGLTIIILVIILVIILIMVEVVLFMTVDGATRQTPSIYPRTCTLCPLLPSHAMHAYVRHSAHGVRSQKGTKTRPLQ